MSPSLRFFTPWFAIGLTGLVALPSLGQDLVDLEDISRVPDTVAGYALEDFPEVGEPPTVELLEEGKAPLGIYQFKRPVSSTDMMMAELDLGVKLVGAGMTSPTMELAGVCLCIEIRSDGSTDMGRQFGRVVHFDRYGGDSASGLSGQMLPGAETIEALFVERSVDSQGVLENRRLEKGSAVPGMTRLCFGVLERTLVRPGVILPEDEIGVGAKWQVVEREGANGDRYSVTTFELLGVDGNQLELGLRRERWSGGARLESDDEDKSADLLGAREIVEGNRRVDLDRLVYSAKEKVTLELALFADLMGQAREFELYLTQELRVQTDL